MRNFSVTWLLAFSVALSLQAQTLEIPELEGILLPVAHHALPGAGGASWTTEITVRTPPGGDVFLSPNTYCPTGACGLGWHPPDRIYRAPHWQILGPYLILVDAAFAKNLQIAIRAWDETRTDATFGTEIPAVPLRDFRPADFFLLNVPASEDARGLLRIYAHPSIPNSLARVRLVQAGQIVGETDVLLTERGDTFLEIDSRFLYGELGLPLAAPDPGEGLHIQVFPPAGTRAWAMYTATHETTHHVTIVTP